MSEESPIFRCGRLLKQLGLSHPRVSIAAAGVLATVVLGVATLTFSPRRVPKQEPSQAINSGVQPKGTVADRRDTVPKSESTVVEAEAGIVSKGKVGTALVEVAAASSVNFGSAFCIDASGLFVTAAHVIAPVLKPTSGTVRLVLNGGELGQKVVPARVVRSDAELDLAVLKLEPGGDVPLVRLELGRSDGLLVTAVVTAFGYPLGTGVPHEPGQYPSVSVNVGRITALPKGEGGLSQIQLDAALNLGNSGGPVLDREGKVIGVVAAGIQGAPGLNYAIPVDRLTRFLRSPEVVFDHPPIRGADLDKPVVLTIAVRPPTIGVLPPEVNVAVRLGRGSRGREAAVKRLEDGRFQAEVVPLPPDELIELNVTVSGESVHGKTTDRNLKIGTETYRLSQLSRLQRFDSGPKFRVLTATGKELAEPVEGLGMVDVPRGTSDKPLDLSTASSIEVRLQPAHSIEATVQVKVGSATLATARRELMILESQPQALNAAARTPIQVATPLAPAVSLVAQPRTNADTQAQPVPAEIPLPGVIEDVALGGDRYLVIALQTPQKLLIFDAATATIIKEIPLSDRAFVAAGKKQFIVGYRTQGLFQSWDLSSLTPRKADAEVLPAKARILGIAMGSESDGPLLVIWHVEPPTNRSNTQNAFSELDPRVRCVLVEPASLKSIRLGGFSTNPSGQPTPSLSAGNRRWFVAGQSFFSLTRIPQSRFVPRRGETCLRSGSSQQLRVSWCGT